MNLTMLERETHAAQIERLQRGTRTFATLDVDVRRTVLAKFLMLAEEATDYRTIGPVQRAMYQAAQQRLLDYIAGRPDVVRRARADSLLWLARHDKAQMDALKAEIGAMYELSRFAGGVR